MKIVGLISNLVPYHHARWEAVAERISGEVHLVETTSTDSFKVLEYSHVKPGRYKLHTLFAGRPYDSLPPREIRAALQDLLTKIRPDVLSLNGYWAVESWAALEWGNRFGVPAIVCSESNEFDAPRKPWREVVKKLILSRCAAGLAGGTLQRQYLIRLGMSESSIYLGYDAVDNRYFEENADRARRDADQVRASLELPELYFLAVARFTPKKNLIRLIEAFALYCERTGRGRAWHLVVVGDGPLRADLETRIRELKVGDQVHLAGPRAYAELPAFYGLAQAFVHASSTEQWGLVVNEAMASGVAVLVSNRCGCVPDLIAEGVNGYSFDPTDIEQLAGLFAKVSTERFDLRAMGTKSRDLIAAWGPKRFAEGMVQAAEAAFNAKKRAKALSGLVISLLSNR